MDLLAAARELSWEVGSLRFGPPVACVYNPLDYAFEGHAQYAGRYGVEPREAVLVGMNPGPWGMAQTGVPFGDVAMVRDWLGIEAPIRKPSPEHPKRPIQGFACPRREASGSRIWGWARDRFETPERFFSRFYVANYCPLCFMEEGGRNFTPDHLPAPEARALFDACDRHLRRIVERLKPEIVIGVGAFAEKRATEALRGLDVQIGRILHPSPASPLANKDWAGQAEAGLRALGVNL